MSERLILIREDDLAILVNPVMPKMLVAYNEARARIDQAVYNPELQLEFVATTIEEAYTDSKLAVVPRNPWIAAARAVLKISS